KLIIVTRNVPPSTSRTEGRLKKDASDPPSSTAPVISVKLPKSPKTVALSILFAIGRLPLPPVGLDDFRHRDAKPVFDDDNLAARDQAVVDIDVNRFTDFPVEFDDRAAPELQKLADPHPRLAEHGR